GTPADIAVALEFRAERQVDPLTQRDLVLCEGVDHGFGDLVGGDRETESPPDVFTDPSIPGADDHIVSAPNGRVILGLNVGQTLLGTRLTVVVAEIYRGLHLQRRPVIATMRPAAGEVEIL